MRMRWGLGVAASLAIILAAAGCSRPVPVEETPTDNLSGPFTASPISPSTSATASATPAPIGTLTVRLERDGYKLLFTLKVYELVRLTDVPAQYAPSVEVIKGCLKYDPRAAVVLPILYTVTNETPGGLDYHELIALSAAGGPSPDSYNTYVAPNQERPGTDRCKDTILDAPGWSQGYTRNVYLILDNYYGPIHPAGDWQLVEGARWRIDGMAVLSGVAKCSGAGRVKVDPGTCLLWVEKPPSS